MSQDNKDQLIDELRAEIKMLWKVIEMLPGNVFWKDTEGRYLGCNRNVATTLKLSSPEKVKGLTDFELLNLETATRIREIDLNVINSKKESCIEEKADPTDGTNAVYFSLKTPLLNEEGEAEGVLGISFDITDRKIMEEKLKIAKKKAEAGNRAKSRFLALVSHELRTPLTSIIGFAELLKKDNMAHAKQHEYFQHIIHSGSYLLSLINNILDYNQLETKKLDLNLHPFNLKQLLDDVVFMLNGTANLKQLPILIHYDQNAPDYIIGDNRVLKQIMINLIGNALKFTESGHIAINITCLENLTDSTHLKIEVEDTGIGISEQEQKSIYKRFYQASNVYTRNNSLTGTGLGLAIVKKLVKQLGSQIHVNSAPQQGTTFYFSTYFALPTSHQSAQIPTDFHHNPNALLIEDDALIQMVHKNMLEQLGCTVDVTHSGVDALDKMKNSYDILFVDIGLPEMNGFELIKAIRQNHHPRDRLPIVALTSYSERGDHQKCLQFGANEVATKPISIEELGKILHKYMRVKN